MSNLSTACSNIPMILVSEEKIHERLQGLAQQINVDYQSRDIDLVCLTNSAMTFMTDLVRLIQRPVKLHTIAFDSYKPAPKSGEVRLTLDVTTPLEGRHVLVVEGMVISGRTPLYLMNLLRLRQPASLELCVIGSKPTELAVDLPIKYRLFDFGSEWVAGYGIGNESHKVSPHLIDLKSTL